MTQNLVFKSVVDILTREDIPYMVTGSIAATFYGHARSTYDVDIVIAPSEESLGALVRAVSREFYVSEDAARQALAHRRMFNIIHNTTGLKIDLIVCKARDFDRSALSRRHPGEAQGVPCVVIAQEDLVLQKLLWAKRSESERQRRDAWFVLHTQPHALDMDYLRTWAEELGLTEDLAALLAQGPPEESS